MTITLHSTDQFVTHEGVKCRIWEGKTDAGIDVFALVPRVAARSTDDLSEFTRELNEIHHPASKDAIKAFDARQF